MGFSGAYNYIFSGSFNTYYFWVPIVDSRGQSSYALVGVQQVKVFSFVFHISYRLAKGCVEYSFLFIIMPPQHRMASCICGTSSFTLHRRWLFGWDLVETYFDSVPLEV